MVDQAMETKPPLGVGGIVGESFSLLFRRFGIFFLLAFIPALISTGISVLYNGTSMFESPEDPSAALEAMTDPVGIALTFVLPMIIYGFSTALIVCAAYDTKLGRPSRIGEYFAIAMRRAVPILLISLALGLIIGVGFMLFVIPGLYLAAMFSVSIVAVVLESGWLGALGRSKRLTKEYRWPILGALILLYIAMFLIQIALGFASAAAFTVNSVVGIAVYAASVAIGTALLSIGFVLIYARLREIKEGVSVDTLAEVFS